MRLVAIFALLASVFFVLPADAAPKKPDVTVVHKEVDMTLHADTDFTPMQRAAIEEAAAKWKEFSNGRVRLTIKFDLDFNSVSNLRAHKAAHDTVMISTPEDTELVEQVDAQANEGRPVQTMHVLAFTFPPGRGVDPAIFVVVSRINPKAFRAIIQHELGHMIGLPDLPSVGVDIMSGASKNGEQASEFTDADRALCRSAKYCD